MESTKLQAWNHKNVHEELVANKKQFGLVHSICLESGFGFPQLFMADTMDEIRAKLTELTSGKYPFAGDIKTDDFHSMEFKIIKSHHIVFCK